jgi:predicted dehydrogenase
LDREKSGGIFVEHGVHFFDLFDGWLGMGEVVAAQSTQRTVRTVSKLPEDVAGRINTYPTEIEDQVQCAVRYGEKTLVNFYHGFHQPGRLVFERGDLTLYDWIPTRVKIHAIASELDTRTLCELFPHARLDVTEVYPPRQRICRGRNKEIEVYQMLELSWGHDQNKMHRYGQLLRALMEDQIAWIADRNHARRVTGQNGRDSLALAVAADRLAHE